MIILHYPAVVLSPLDGGLEGGVTVKLVITVSGNPANTYRNVNVTPFEEPSNGHPVNTSPATREFLHPATYSASIGNSILHATTDTKIVPLNTQFVRTTPQPLQHVASIPTDTTTGLASALSNLELIVNVDNLSNNVSTLVSVEPSFVHLTDPPQHHFLGAFFGEGGLEPCQSCSRDRSCATQY